MLVSTDTMENAGHDPTVAGPAFMASLDALVAASTRGSGAIDEDALRYCLETLDGRIAELKVGSRDGGAVWRDASWAGSCHPMRGLVRCGETRLRRGLRGAWR